MITPSPYRIALIPHVTILSAHEKHVQIQVSVVVDKERAKIGLWKILEPETPSLGKNNLSVLGRIEMPALWVTVFLTEGRWDSHIPLQCSLLCGTRDHARQV